MADSPKEQRKLAAIMFTDMVGYSALTQRNESLALELLEEHRRLLRNLFPKFDGREVETTGDGFLVEFASALEASKCAIEIQRAVSTRNLTVSHDRQIQLRIGIHVGDVIHKDGHVLGDGVNIAARLQPLAEPGGICISVDVARQVQNNLQATVVKMGEAELKNIRLPMEICRIVLPWQKDTAAQVAPRTPKLRAKNALSVALTLVGIALGAMGIWLCYNSGRVAKLETVPQTNAAPPFAHAPEAKSVAVLPFVNMSADKGDEYLSDGMTEELLNVLAKIKGLRVPGRSSSFAFKGKNEEGIFRRVGEQLHVNAVLEGSVRKEGDQLRITAQLINVSDGFHLWSETYDRAMTNIFAIQSDIAGRVARALKVQLLGTAEQRKQPTENIEAYKWYLQGRQLWERRSTETLAEAIACFTRAIAADPAYALAYSGLADCYAVMPGWIGMSQRETAPKGRAAALKAIELDDRLGEPHAALGFFKAFYDWDWLGAEANFRHAIELNSEYATAHLYFGAVLEKQRRFDEALTEFQRALEIDPLSSNIKRCVGFALFETGKEELGVQTLQKLIGLDAGFVGAHQYLGLIYLKQGKFSEAIIELEKADKLATGLWGFASARAGRTNDAQKVLVRLLDLQQQGVNATTVLEIAYVQHGLGNEAQALDGLERAAEERLWRIIELNQYPIWDDLRPHPRAQAILRTMNLVK